MAQEQEPSRLVDTFRGVAFAEQGQGWDALWNQSWTPWDRGGHGPALEDLLTERRDLFGPAAPAGAGRKKALVPGCGHGHDVLLISTFGYDVYGLDYSPKATEQAIENERRTGSDEVYRARESAERGTVTWLTGDFFRDDFVKEAGVDKFDLIYDYTVGGIASSVCIVYIVYIARLCAPC